ncbi:MAG: phage virion morphogenesis protein [Kiritimatiellae bacterium]|nr:phage virion morphogenesis protein [Kiritimatiellia bacterium]
MSASFQVDGGEKLARAIRALGSAEAMARVARVAGEELAIMAAEAFHSERVRPAEWPPLSRRTEAGMSKARKRGAKKRGSARPLVDTGTLMRSFEVGAADGDGVTVKSTQDYAVYHQYGTRKMPARPFIPATGGFDEVAQPTDLARRRLETAMTRALAEEARRNGFATSD